MTRPASAKRLAAYIRQHQSAILAAWATQLQTADSSRAWSSEHWPELLERIAGAVETRDRSIRPTKGLANDYAVAGLQAGFSLRELIGQFRTLRRVLMEHLDTATHHHAGYIGAVALLHDIIDRAVANVVDEYSAERDRTRDRFISILGHDLSQPLNAIQFGAQALVSGAAGDASAQKTAALMASSAVRMQTMIADLLEFARGRGRQAMPITPIPVNAAALVSRITEEIAAAHPSRSIQCLAADCGGDGDVEWDEPRMTQALSNLLTNAVVHGTDPVTLEAVSRDEFVCIEVRNHGEIAPDVLPRLFEPFAGSADRHGLGLGLYIVDRVVSAHGGTVRARSSNGVTSIQLRVPRRPVARHARAGS
jgi:signal transduction histidine kinase